VCSQAKATRPAVHHPPANCEPTWHASPLKPHPNLNTTTTTHHNNPTQQLSYTPELRTDRQAVQQLVVELGALLQFEVNAVRIFEWVRLGKGLGLGWLTGH